MQARVGFHNVKQGHFISFTLYRTLASLVLPLSTESQLHTLTKNNLKTIGGQGELSCQTVPLSPFHALPCPSFLPCCHSHSFTSFQKTNKLVLVRLGVHRTNRVTLSVPRPTLPWVFPCLKSHLHTPSHPGQGVHYDVIKR